jgi:hypothetical protein
MALATFWMMFVRICATTDRYSRSLPDGRSLDRTPMSAALRVVKFGKSLLAQPCHGLMSRARLFSELDSVGNLGIWLTAVTPGASLAGGM